MRYTNRQPLAFFNEASSSRKTSMVAKASRNKLESTRWSACTSAEVRLLLLASVGCERTLIHTRSTGGSTDRGMPIYEEES